MLFLVLEQQLLARFHLLNLYWQQRMGRILLHGMAMVLLVSLVGGVTAGGWLLYQQKQTDATSQVSESYLEFAERALSENAQQSRSVVKVVTDSIHRRTTTLGRAVVPGMFRTYPEDGGTLGSDTDSYLLFKSSAEVCNYCRTLLPVHFAALA